MKSSIMGIIYTGERDQQLRELTNVRAVAAVPLCARYRLIDFPLSSLVDSGVRNVGVIMQRNYNSLMDHLGSGKEWDLHGKNEGLHILPYLPCSFAACSQFQRYRCLSCLRNCP